MNKMGYTTEFIGKFTFNREPSQELVEYINRFSRTRHVKRDVEGIKRKYSDWKTRSWKGIIGNDGEFFVLDYSEMDYTKIKRLDREGYLKDNCLVDDINPPYSQPGIWCQWIINKSNELVWNGGEKFCEYTKWLAYLIRNFFEPEGFILSGKCFYCGERFDDWGYLCVDDNKVIKIPNDIPSDTIKDIISVRLPEKSLYELETELGIRYGITLEQATRKFIRWCADNPENFKVWSDTFAKNP